jgi:glutamate carboxypeptidase
VRDLLSACLNESDALLALARDLTAIESPSHDRAALERCAAALGRTAKAAGASVSRPDGGGTTAAHVLARWPGEAPPVLLLGHFDTVWPIGQLAIQPIEGRMAACSVQDL